MYQEHNVLVIRYILYNRETNKFEIQERFWKFFNFNEKTGENITTMLIKALYRHNIPLVGS